MRRHWWLKKYDNIYILWKSLKVHNPYPNPCVSQIENFSDFRKEKQWIYYLFHATNRGLGQPPTIKHINIFFSGKHEGLKQNYLMLVQKVNLHYSCLFPSFVEFGNVDEGLWPVHVWNVKNQWTSGKLGGKLDTCGISVRVWASDVLELVDTGS